MTPTTLSATQYYKQLTQRLKHTRTQSFTKGDIQHFLSDTLIEMLDGSITTNLERVQYAKTLIDEEKLIAYAKMHNNVLNEAAFKSVYKKQNPKTRPQAVGMVVKSCIAKLVLSKALLPTPQPGVYTLAKEAQ